MQFGAKYPKGQEDTLNSYNNVNVSLISSYRGAKTVEKGVEDRGHDKAPEHERRLQQTSLFELEKCFILRTGINLLNVALSRKFLNLADDSHYQRKFQGKVPVAAIETGGEILRFNGLRATDNLNHEMLLRLIEAIRTRLNHILVLDRLEDATPNSLTYYRKEHELVDILYMGQILLTLVETSEKLPSASLISSWFKLCCDYEFFSSDKIVSYLNYRFGGASL